MTYFEKIKNYQIKENPIIMGIETSCDETAVAIIKNGREILADEIISSMVFNKRIWTENVASNLTAPFNLFNFAFNILVTF